MHAARGMFGAAKAATAPASRTAHGPLPIIAPEALMVMEMSEKSHVYLLCHTDPFRYIEK
jgi:hypothetical protein